MLFRILTNAQRIYLAQPLNYRVVGIYFVYGFQYHRSSISKNRSDFIPFYAIYTFNDDFRIYRIKYSFLFIHKSVQYCHYKPDDLCYGMNDP